MNRFSKLTLKILLQKHKKKPKDKKLHKIIETKEIEKEHFNKLIREATKLKPFDKKKQFIYEFPISQRCKK